MGSIAARTGCSSESLRKRVRWAGHDQGVSAGHPSEERERLVAPERDSRASCRSVARKTPGSGAQSSGPGSSRQRARTTRPASVKISNLETD